MIDLDLLVPQPEEPPWPADARRRWLIFGAFALVLFMVSGAAAPAGPALVQVRTATLVAASSYRILGDALYVAEVRPDGNWLTAYPLPAGPPRWSTRLDVLASNVALDEMDGVILVGMFQPGVSGDHTAALDRVTGALRWRSPLNVAAVDRIRGQVVLTAYPAARIGSGPPPADVMAVSAGTGVRVWSYRRPGGCEGDLPYTVTDRRTGLAILCSNGQLELFDLDTGKVRARAAVPETLAVGFGARVVALPDRVVVSYPSAGGSVLVSFDLDRLRTDWTSRVEQGNYFISDCGPRICLGNSTAALALDRYTGRIVWSVRPVGFAAPLVDRYVLVAPAQFGQIQLVDIGTGRVMMNLGDWSAEIAPVGLPMFFRSDGATGRTWVARVSEQPSGVRVLGFVPDARPETCGSSRGYLVCRTVKDTVTVWRFAVG